MLNIADIRTFSKMENYERINPAQGYLGSLTVLDAALNNRDKSFVEKVY